MSTLPPAPGGGEGPVEGEVEGRSKVTFPAYGSVIDVEKWIIKLPPEEKAAFHHALEKAWWEKRERENTTFWEEHSLFTKLAYLGQAEVWGLLHDVLLGEED